jgi:hypothetical protein
MRTFTDNDGQEWSTDLNVGLLKTVADATGVRLHTLFDNNVELFARLTGDLFLFVDVLWCVVADQAVERGVTRDDFAKRLGGQSLGDSTVALARAVADIAPDAECRAGLHKALDKAIAAWQKLTADAHSAIRNLDVDTLASGCLSAIGGK